MYIDVKTLKNAAYKNFISQHLKNIEYIIISMIDDIPSFVWECASLPTNVNFHSINFFKSERLYCFKNNYYDIYSTLNMYNSMEEFLDLTHIYRLMFVASNEVVVICMHDEVIMYNI